MAMWRSMDSDWGVAAVRVVMGLIFLAAGWNKVAAGFGTVATKFGNMGMPAPGRPFVVKLPGAGWAGARLDLMLLAGGVLLFFAGSGRLSIDDVWLERRPA